MSLPAISLKPGRDKPVRQRHPWIFSGSVATADEVEPGGLVDILDAHGQFLARGYANPHSKLLVRILTWDAAEAIDAAFWHRRIAAAVARRLPLLSESTHTACRLIMSEADQLPGLIVDKYQDFLVVQALTAGIDRHLEPIAWALTAELAPLGIIERSDDAVLDLEGLDKRVRLIQGIEPPAAGVAMRENGLTFLVDLREGHKTGFYLDQRENHQRVRQISAGKRVLDCFCYTGGFTLNARAGGAASVLSVDASEPALARLRDNLAANDLADTANCTQLAGNAFEILRSLRDQRESFDLIVLDPPKFAANAAQVDKAARGYKDINLLAFKLLAGRQARDVFLLGAYRRDAVSENHFLRRS